MPADTGKRGRPREFDVEQALDAAMQLFWARGYEGTSLNDLTGAMGINRPSLYAAFGTKQELFRKVLDRYVANPASYVRKALLEPTARAVTEALLRGTVRVTTSPRNPRGCLLTLGAIVGSPESEGAHQEACVCRTAGEKQIRKRFERARAEGDLPDSVNIPDLVNYVTTVMYGLSVKAANGSSRSELERMIGLAMEALPREPK